MKKYIILTNQGEIVPEDLTLIGSSTKRGDSSKIGQFGSGWKYALAWVMRNDLDIRIFSGTKEFKLAFEKIDHRGKDVKVLTVNGEKTSITSGMGEIDWTAWMALREILSNAIDEGSETIEIKRENEFKFESKAGTTTIFLEAGKGLEEVMANYHNYFTFDRPAIYEDENIRVFEKPSSYRGDRVFRKNILCCEGDSDLVGHYDYSLNEVTINESRLASSYDIRTALVAAALEVKNPLIQVKLLASLGTKNIFNLGDYDKIMIALYPSYKSLIEEEKIDVHPKSFKSRVNEALSELVFTSKTVLFIDDPIYEALAEEGVVEPIFERYFSSLAGGKTFENDEGVIMEILEDEESNEAIKKFASFAYPVLPVKMKLVQFMGKDNFEHYHFSVAKKTLFISSGIQYRLVNDPYYAIACILGMGKNRVETILRTILTYEDIDS